MKTTMTPWTRRVLASELHSQLLKYAVRKSDLSRLHLSPCEISLAAEIYAPDAPPNEVWQCYKEELPKVVAKTRAIRSRTDELERIELDEASQDDPRNAKTPADPTANFRVVTMDELRKMDVAQCAFRAIMGDDEHLPLIDDSFTAECHACGKGYNYNAFSIARDGVVVFNATEASIMATCTNCKTPDPIGYVQKSKDE